MSNAIIAAFFETRIKTFAATESTTLTVAYEDVPFTPPERGAYLEIFLLPANTINCTVDGIRNRYLGIFQVNIYTKAGTGRKTSEILEKKIIDLFPVVPKGTVSIEQTPSAYRIHQELAGWKCTAISINYRYEA